jgi:hypothetical protein
VVPRDIGYPVYVSSGCAEETWAFTAKSTFDGYTAYEITNNGDCATVTKSDGAHYTQNNVVLENCVGSQ